MSQYYRNHPDEPIRHDWFALGERESEAAADIAAERALYLQNLEIERRAEQSKLTAKEHGAFPKGRWT